MFDFFIKAQGRGDGEGEGERGICLKNKTLAKIIQIKKKLNPVDIWRI